MAEVIVGVPKEIKLQGSRVGMTPAGVDAQVRQGCQVLVEYSAGAGSGFHDDAYRAVGARLVAAEEAWAGRLDDCQGQGATAPRRSATLLRLAPGVLYLLSPCPPQWS